MKAREMCSTTCTEEQTRMFRALNGWPLFFELAQLNTVFRHP